jgi:Arc/MetJ-type ribon-helix-helix transcriptional regulator
VLTSLLEILMGTTRVAFNVNEDLLRRVDRLVEERRFPDRNQVVQVALEEKIARLDRSRFLQEAAKLDPTEEKALAEEGLAGDVAEWPRY